MELEVDYDDDGDGDEYDDVAVGRYAPYTLFIY